MPGTNPGTKSSYSGTKLRPIIGPAGVSSKIFRENKLPRVAKPSEQDKTDKTLLFIRGLTKNTNL